MIKIFKKRDDTLTYEDLLMEADRIGLVVKEKPLPISDGRIKGKRIAIRQDIPTQAQKADVLAEELGHYYTTVGDIFNQATVGQEKQEQRARLYAYNLRIGLDGLLRAFKAHCQTTYEIANFLDVSEEFLMEAIERYRQIYGTGTMIDNYYIRFEPYLSIQTYHFIM